MKEKNDTISKRRANYIVSHYYPVVKKDPGQGSKEVYVNLEVDFYSRTYNITSKNSSNDKFNFTNNSVTNASVDIAVCECIKKAIRLAEKLFKQTSNGLGNN